MNSVDIAGYNKFCKSMREGYILYNVDRTNCWGEYFLVANISTIKIDDIITYSMLLLGLKKQDKEFIPRNVKIRITPDSAKNIPFLKYIGKCNFSFTSEIKRINVNMGLITILKDVNLRDYARKLHIRKPKNRKYSKCGDSIVDKTDNYETEDFCKKI